MSSSSAFSGIASHVPRARNSNTSLVMGSGTGQTIQGQSFLPTSVRRPPQSGRLTWTFAFCALFAMGSFFVAHVALSLWLASDESLMESKRIPNFRRQHHQQASQSGASGDSTKRILVLGSHHTGTSIVTKLLIEGGAYPGEDLVMLPGNPLKYNENRAAVEADKRVMSYGHGNLARRGPSWVDFEFQWGFVPPNEQQLFTRSVDEVIRNLEQGALAKGKKAWVLKDPRMSILADQWVSRTPNAICVLVTRNPIETSKRLARSYNRGPRQSLTVHEWMTFWSEAMQNSVRACLKHKRRIVFAHHADLAKDPLRFAQKLEKDVFGDVKKYSEPSSISMVLGPNFGPKAAVDPEDDPNAPQNQRFWTTPVRKVWESLAKQDLSDIATSSQQQQQLPLDATMMNDPAPPVLAGSVSRHPETTVKPSTVVSTGDYRRQAYATIITGNDKGFVAGALTLAQSIRQFDTKRDLVAMLSVEVNDPSVRKALVLAGWKTVEVQKLEEPWFQTHPKCRRFTDSQVVRWGRMFSKLRMYSLPYDRVLYMDTDTVVLRDPSVFFSYPRDFYGERSPSHRGINAGIMLIRPSEQVLDQLITYAREHEPLEFWKSNQVGCTEQELLNRFWNGANPENKLNNTRHFDYLNRAFIEDEGRDENRLEGARIAHCLTTKCNKPWDVAIASLIPSSPDFDKYVIQPHCDLLMYLVWYRNFLHPDLEEARSVLTSSGDVSADAMRTDPRYGFKEISAEIEMIAGEHHESFRRDWRQQTELESPADSNNDGGDGNVLKIPRRARRHEQGRA